MCMCVSNVYATNSQINESATPEKEAIKEEEKSEEEEQVFEYNYEEMKSGPECNNVSTHNMLELLYPHCAFPMCSIIVAPN